MKKLLAILLTVFLFIMGVVFLSSCNYPFAYFYNDADQYVTYDEASAVYGSEIDVETLTHLSVDWVTGDVSIEKYDGDTLRFTEQGTSISKAQQLRWFVDNNKLTIKFMESGIRISNNYQKNLVVHVPTGLQLADVNVSCVSANLSVSGLNSDNFELESVSGEVSAQQLVGTNVKIDMVSGVISTSFVDSTQLTLESVSGDIYAENITTQTMHTKSTSGHMTISALTAVNKVTAKSTSGKISCNYSALPLESEFNSVSGDVNLIFPENDGFSIQFSSVSGRMRNGFGETNENGSFSYLNATKTISVHTTSGSCIVLKK